MSSAFHGGQVPSRVFLSATLSNFPPAFTSTAALSLFPLLFLPPTPSNTKPRRARDIAAAPPSPSKLNIVTLVVFPFLVKYITMLVARWAQVVGRPALISKRSLKMPSSQLTSHPLLLVE